VLDLPGGPVRDGLPTIASQQGAWASIEKLAEKIAAHTATGLRGTKVGFSKAGNAHLGFERARDIDEKVSRRRAPARSF